MMLNGNSMKQEKLLILAGASSQIPVIKYAKQKGYYVITADYLPDNLGHKFADEYVDVSTIDKEKVLQVAIDKKIDGILAYATDPAAPTAAYVSTKLNLPGNDYEVVKTMQRKDLFRTFLSKYDFPIPEFGSFIEYAEAYNFTEKILLTGRKAIIKPTDSSGSKGVSIINKLGEFENKFKYSQEYSMSGFVIVEEFIERAGNHMDGDCFVDNGKIVFCCFGNQLKDDSCFSDVPCAHSFPYIAPEYIKTKASKLIQNIITKIGFNSGGINFEFIYDKNDTVYIIDIGPRNGGNLVPEGIMYYTGVRLMALAVEAALGHDIPHEMYRSNITDNVYSSYLIHSQKPGIIKSIFIDDYIRDKIIYTQTNLNVGDHIDSFINSNGVASRIMIKHDNINELNELINNMNNYIKVLVD